MATFVRNRVLNQLQWTEEPESYRARRREFLCELDGMLAQLEEINLRGQALPPRILAQLRRKGVAFPARVSPAELIEAVFAAQERFMRQPEGLLPPSRGDMEVHGRLAS
jgi:hypothetical protein